MTIQEEILRELKIIKVGLIVLLGMVMIVLHSLLIILKPIIEKTN